MGNCSSNEQFEKFREMLLRININDSISELNHVVLSLWEFYNKLNKTEKSKYDYICKKVLESK